MDNPSIDDLEDPSILQHGGVSMIKRKPANHVRFYNDAKQDMEASEKEGRPIYKDVEMVEIFAQGGSHTVLKKVTDEHREMYSHQYQAWKKGQEVAVEGTPLEMWPNPLMTPSMIQNLKFFQVYSVEQLADLTDSTIQKIGLGGIKLRKDASEYIERAHGVEPQMAALKTENTELKDRLSALEKQLEALSKPKAKAKRKRKKADDDTISSSKRDEGTGDT